MKKIKIFTYLIAILVTVIMLLPFVWGLLLSFKDNFGIFNDPFGLPKNIDLGLYIKTFKVAHLGTLFKNSLLLATAVTIVELIVIFLSSFSIARLYHKYKGMSDFFNYAFLAASAVPTIVLLVTYYGISMKLGKLSGGIFGINSIWGLMFPYVAGGIPFFTLVFVGAMKGIPLEMEEAGIIDGCNLLRLIFNIDFPLLKPVVVTLLIFAFLGSWNEFNIASIQLNSKDRYTIPMALAFFKDQFSQDYGAMMRSVVMILIPQVIFYAVFQKQIIEGMATAGLKG